MRGEWDYWGAWIDLYFVFFILRSEAMLGFNHFGRTPNVIKVRISVWYQLTAALDHINSWVGKFTKLGFLLYMCACHHLIIIANPGLFCMNPWICVGCKSSKCSVHMLIWSQCLPQIWKGWRTHLLGHITMTTRKLAIRGSKPQLTCLFQFKLSSDFNATTQMCNLVSLKPCPKNQTQNPWNL